MNDRRARTFLTVLLLTSAALFAIGVAMERHDERSESRGKAANIGGLLLADAGGEGETAAGGETSGETPAERRAEGHSETRAEHRAEHANERVFGVNLESSPLVGAAVAVSFLFAVALWLTPNPLVPLAIAGFALVAAVFDVREVFHQIDASRAGEATIAAVVAMLHLAAAAVALVLVRAAGMLFRRPAT